MRIGFLVLLLVFAGALASARADVILSGSASTTFNGSVSTLVQGGTGCSNSGAGASSLGLTCSSGTAPQPNAFALAQGIGDQFGGDILAESFAVGPINQPGSAQASIEFDLLGRYVLTGGMGTATIEFAISADPYRSALQTCRFSFNSVAQVCDLGTGSFTETVQYDVPFSVDMDLNVLANAFNGQPAEGSISYDFSPSGIQATPEPSSIFLLMPGLAGVMFAARSRARGQLAR